MRTGRSEAIDMPELFRQMARIRHFERATAELWRRGLIGGEMHLGLGEKAMLLEMLGSEEGLCRGRGGHMHMLSLAEERTGAAFARVAVTDTLPYARHLEDEALPSVPRILAAAERLLEVSCGACLSAPIAQTRP